jgi:hypothetical protein
MIVIESADGQRKTMLLSREGQGIVLIQNNRQGNTVWFGDEEAIQLRDILNKTYPEVIEV